LAIPIIVILVLLWVAVLVPEWMRSRGIGRRGAIGDYTSKLGALARTGPSQPGRVPMNTVTMHSSVPRGVNRGARAISAVSGPLPGRIGPTPAQRRRRDVLAVLGITVVVTLLAAVFTGSTMVWVLQIVADVLLVAYLVLMTRMRSLATERRGKVHYLPHPAAPQLTLRRSASS